MECDCSDIEHFEEGWGKLNLEYKCYRCNGEGLYPPQRLAKPGMIREVCDCCKGQGHGLTCFGEQLLEFFKKYMRANDGN